MAVMVTGNLYPKLWTITKGKPKKQGEKPGDQEINKLLFKKALSELPGFNELYACSSESSPTNVVDGIMAKFLQENNQEYSGAITTINYWMTGENEMIRYVIRRSAAGNVHTHHVVNLVSALNYTLNCFSYPGDSIEDHIENVSKFFAKIVGKGGNEVAPVIFYVRSLRDLAFSICTYCRKTNNDFIELVEELESELKEANENRSQTSRRPTHYSTTSVNNDVVLTILNGCLCDNTLYNCVQEGTNESSCTAPLYDFDQKFIKVRAELKTCIQAHPEYFSEHRYYSTISDIITWYDNENINFGNRGVLDCIDNEFYLALYSDKKIPELEGKSKEALDALKEKNLEFFYSKLALAVFENVPEVKKLKMTTKEDLATGEKIKKLRWVKEEADKLFGIEGSDPQVRAIEGIIILLRFSMIVSIIDHYISRSSTGGTREQYDSNEVIRMINENMDEFGLVRLTGFHRKSAQIDWCLHQYIADENVRNEAIEYLNKVKQGDSYVF